MNFRENCALTVLLIITLYYTLLPPYKIPKKLTKDETRQERRGGESVLIHFYQIVAFLS